MKDIPENQRSKKSRWTERERGRLSNLGVRGLGKDMSEILKIVEGLDSVHKEWGAPSEWLAGWGATFEIWGQEDSNKNKEVSANTPAQGLRPLPQVEP